ncbi:aminoglycoside phosphotransferase family protein [Actinotalea sp. M2MS4P-6]|uniref:phosphotransferase family protein n=1 Tax=Actinotalea sp. M2MS4P-6 TaxID=2983762 RepID=UPI0021E38114|nr:aminoglycoside phosphotransferase family protein [Actinotalea sp. M2MS4P-6]MCV2394057.1 aminoglycoside phosphotransferase family protein [Actinotalea sp. M2MS4P-6]
MTDEGPPLAFSGSRLAWADLPRSLKARIAELSGAAVVAEAPATTGFSPGYASLLELGDGTEVFVKAVSPEQNPDSPNLARAEIRAIESLPPGVPAPRLLWSHDDGWWVMLGIEAVPGRPPEHPWRDEQLVRVLDVITELAEAGTPAPEQLPPITVALSGLAACWPQLAAEPDDLEAAAAAVGEHGEWLRAHLDDAASWAAEAPERAVGHTIAHNDLRADNVLLGDHGVWIVDWPHASRDAPAWFDLAGMLPSIAMQGGGDPAELFWSHPTAEGADPDVVRAVVSGLTGYFVRNAVQPAPPGIANLRPFQLAQGIAALDWLRRF